MKLTLTYDQIAEAYSAFMFATGNRESIEALLAVLPEPELAEPTEAEINRARQIYNGGLHAGCAHYDMGDVLADFIASRKRPESKRDRAIAKLDSVRGVYASDPTNAELADTILALGGE